MSMKQQIKVQLIKDNARYAYKHNGRNVYCLIHPRNLNGNYLVHSLVKAFDVKEGFFYYETYERVSIKEIDTEFLLEYLV